MYEYLENPKLIDELSLETLKDWIQEMPYNQNLRMLYALRHGQMFGSDNMQPFQEAAIYATDRNALYEVYTEMEEKRVALEQKKSIDAKSKKVEKRKKKKKQAKQKKSIPPPSEVEMEEEMEYDMEEAIKVDEHVENVDDKGEDPKPSVTTEEDIEIAMSSSEELDMVVESTTDQKNEHSDQENLADLSVEEILENNGSRSYDLSEFSKWLMTLPGMDHSRDKTYTNEIDEDLELVSTSLAELLVKQGHYEKAIKMYEKLALKNPEKSDYFAAQIEKLRSI